MATDLSISMSDGTASAVPGTTNAYAITVTNNGPDSGTTINSGGVEVVVAGGVDSGATLNSGALQIVLGSAAGATLNAGATQVVSAGGGATSAKINGGFEVVYGATSATAINSGGAEAVVSGGIDSGAQINSGGIEVVFSGGLASAATISGGTLEIMSGGSTGAGALTFATSAGGILQLDDSQHFGGLVAGFGQPDFIDLSDIAFGSGTALSYTSANPGNTSGTLTVNDGVHSANITLIGQYATGNFTSASDGHGGTLIGDPPVMAQTDPPPAALVSPHSA